MVNLLYRSSSSATTPTLTSAKGAPLTNLEVDGNFKSIQDGIEAITSGSTPLVSPALEGTPTAPTASVGTSTTQLATTKFVVDQITADTPSKTGTGATGTWDISVSGNAATVTNGVVTTGLYTDPGWIATLDDSKVLPTMTGNTGKYLTTDGTNSSWVTIAIGENAVLTTGSYANPSWITALATSKLTGDIVATNGVVTTNTYADPVWITSLATSKLTGTINGSLLTGTVVATNGVVTTGSYANPSWITSLATSKLTGDIVVTNGVVTTGSYANPSWITALATSKLTGDIVATNGVVTTGSYANPSWITALAETKVLPTQTGNTNELLVTNGTITGWSEGLTYSSGTLTTTNFNSLSDINYKKSINNIKDATNTIKQLSGVEFEWKNNGKKSSGVIAQELEKVLPHLVEINDGGIKTVNYAGLTAYLIESIKELSAKIESL